MTSKILNAIKNSLVYSSVGSGRKVVTTNGTAVALASSTVCKKVIVTAEVNNTEEVTVGGSAVIGALLTRVGIPLEPGASEIFEIDNLSKLYIDSIVNGEGVTYIYFV